MRTLFFLGGGRETEREASNGMAAGTCADDLPEVLAAPPPDQGKREATATQGGGVEHLSAPSSALALYIRQATGTLLAWLPPERPRYLFIGERSKRKVAWLAPGQPPDY